MAVYHGEIDALLILKCVEELNQPLALGSCQYVSLCQYMPNFIKLEKQLLAHHFQRAYLPSIFLGSQEHLAVSTLSNLSEDLEVSMMQSRATFAQIGSFSAEVFVSCCFILRRGCSRRRRKLRCEEILTILATVDVTQ